MPDPGQHVRRLRGGNEVGMLSGVQRRLKNEPSSGHAEPPGLGRMWDFPVKGVGGLKEHSPVPHFLLPHPLPRPTVLCISRLQEKDHQRPLCLMCKTILETK